MDDREAFNEYRRWRYHNDADYRERAKMQARVSRRGEQAREGPLDLRAFAAMRPRGEHGRFVR